ncbi:hypothetical protein RHMOL_Rhmol01G0136700 [Rhododendron molle]|uniref:Uncharacterized protein n=1 Tax=Rhododendron molle TaxID=49168 RepID=A0ACC0Q1R8_RHOML|nr:hypothetical protein RHMOL_Rhmol01G0136700 [Rhododendron molle]
MIHFSHKDILWEIIGVKTLSISRLLRKITIQEPMFERIIVVYRRAKSKKESDRGIYVRHFKKIPMADMDIVLVKEVIISFFILMEQSKATRQLLRERISEMRALQVVVSSCNKADFIKGASPETQGKTLRRNATKTI